MGCPGGGFQLGLGYSVFSVVVSTINWGKDEKGGKTKKIGKRGGWEERELV